MGFALKQVEKIAPTKPDAECNPYLAARHEWDERYGDLVTRAKNWRTMALVSGLVALLAAGAGDKTPGRDCAGPDNDRKAEFRVQADRRR